MHSAASKKYDGKIIRNIRTSIREDEGAKSHAPIECMRQTLPRMSVIVVVRDASEHYWHWNVYNFNTTFITRSESRKHGFKIYRVSEKLVIFIKHNIQNTIKTKSSQSHFCPALFRTKSTKYVSYHTQLSVKRSHTNEDISRTRDVGSASRSSRRLRRHCAV